MSDDWDKLSRTTVTGTIAETEVEDFEPTDMASLMDEIDRLAPELLAAQAELESAKEKVKRLTEDLSRYTPEVSGEVTVVARKYTLTVKRAERMEWDSEVLSAIYSGMEHFPDHVKMKLSIDKRRYERLSPEDKDAIKSALTIKLASPSVEVRPNV